MGLRESSAPIFSPDGRKTARAIGVYWEQSSLLHKSPFDFSTPIVLVSDIASTKELRIEDFNFHNEDEGDEPTVQSAVWTNDGRELVVAGRRQIRRFDAQSGKLLSRAAFAGLTPLKKGEMPVVSTDERNVAISPNGRLFLRHDSPQVLTIRDTKPPASKDKSRLERNGNPTLISVGATKATSCGLPTVGLIFSMPLRVVSCGHGMA